MRYWLMKSEPNVFSISDLYKQHTTLWDGVRNYQARNFMQKEMCVGDEVLFYHSNAEPPGVAGIAKVAEEAVPDPSQFDKKSKYYDPKATHEKPIWYCVRIEFVRKFDRLVSLQELRNASDLTGMMVLAKGQRLSIQPVTAQEFKGVCGLASSR